MSSEQDPFLDAAAEKPEKLAFTEKEVSALISISCRKLQEMRAQNIKPPVWRKIGKSVRYPARPLREWINAPDAKEPITAESPRAHSCRASKSRTAAHTDGYEEPLFRGGRRKKVRQTNFAQFLSEGHLLDEWLFLLQGPHRRPIDWLATLDDEERNDEDDVVWLSLGDYLSQLQHAAGAETAASGAAGLESRLSPGKPVDGGRL